MKLVFIALISVFFAASPAHAGKADDELVIGITQFPASFHPNIDSMMAKTYVLAMTRRPFTAYDAEWKLTCMLCVTLPTIDNGLAVPERDPMGKKGIAVTYTIRPEAEWGDGVPVSTKDVVFTWKVGRHPLSGVSDMEFYRSLYKIDVKDEKTFTMHFDKLTFEYNAINNFNLLPAHLDESAFAEPKEYKNRTAYDADTTNEGLYFGPYLITKVESGSHIVLETNPKWWGKKPRFRRIIVRVIGNTAALEANLLSGGIDMIAGELGLTVDQALAFEKRHGRDFNIIYKPGLIYEHIDFNLDNPILKDIRVRRALIHSIDRETVSKQLFVGRLSVAHSSVNPLDWVYDDNVRKYPFDPDLAGRLLREAGWNPASQGPRRNAKGETLTLEIMTTAGNRTREMVEQVLQNQWKAQGVDVRIHNQPARVFFGRTLTERKYSAMAMYAWISAPESVPRTTLHSAHIPSSANNFAGQNYTGFVNEEMDALVDRIEVELDRPKRKDMWRRLQEIYAEELPVIPLYFLAEPYILPTWLKGLVPTGHQDPSTLWVENWRKE
ncbi:MAG: peptide ABC transporter [Rhodospirillales bacterium RIFCSPLOWO2_12_FULL_58_28]|nr:MAG: peptide ABC transporter [Rhodospirillales bacterium RIFCSPLOWO2_02_FULL_58_16]OHC78950.1 MAG: peptide ABC transporter [Rhodospirillales bacterium RIFCSPLOWO2_12_FULL_58_28]